MRKLDFCIYENKAADQLCSYDQRLYFCYTDSKITLLYKSEMINFTLVAFFLRIYMPIYVGPCH